MRVFEIRDAELMETLTRQLEEAGIRDAAIVSLIGASDRLTISTMPADDATDDTLTEYKVPAELVGAGEVVDGRVHLHVVAGIQDAGITDVGKSGHLHEAHIGTHFVRAYVQPVA
jgi:uncharacterized protein